jgi:DNA repair protein RadA/Sms
VGGMKLTEPGADLAIALALASAARDRPYPHTLAAVGEISLAGEIRPATGTKQRVNEATRLGFTTVLGSDSGHLREALRVAFSMTQSPRERELDRAF